jgi:hypothetical protein
MHILQHDHEYGPIDKTLEILKIVNKGKYLDVLERFHIYRASKCKEILNEQYATESNALFDLVINHSKKQAKH